MQVEQVAEDIFSKIRYGESIGTYKTYLLNDTRKLLQNISIKYQDNNYDIFSWSIIDLNKHGNYHNFQCLVFVLRRRNDIYELYGYLSSSERFYEYYADITYHKLEQKLWIQDNYIKTLELQNKGIGSEGINCIKKLARQLNCIQIQGKMQPRNINDTNELQKLVRFYMANGFKCNEATKLITFDMNN